MTTIDVRTLQVGTTFVSDVFSSSLELQRYLVTAAPIPNPIKRITVVRARRHTDHGGLRAEHDYPFVLDEQVEVES